MVELEKIQTQVNKVLAFSQDIPIEQLKTDRLIEKWYNAKKDIIKAFDGELIYQFPGKVSFELSEREKQNRIQEFVETVSFHWDNQPLADFILSNKDTFFDNLVKEGIIINDEKKIPKGMKLIRAFKFFEEDPYALNELQSKASELIQKDKVEGYLCFSVHPLDFLSSSENTYNWRSCHSLDGAYRSGNLSYMMDSSTVVCYLKGEKEDCMLPNFPNDVLWNSKKWRMLLFLSDNWDAMFAGRQYPFMTESALEAIRNISMNAFKFSGSWSLWQKDRIYSYESEGRKNPLKYDYLPINGILYTEKDLITDGKDSQHFNDLTHSSCYVPYYCWKQTFSKRDKIHFSIGESAPCIRCGEDPICVGDEMLCVDCELEYGHSEDDRFMVCECCGRRMLEEEAHYVPAYDQYVCEGCADNECSICPCCGELTFNTDMKYDKINQEDRCLSCHSNTVQRRMDEIANYAHLSIPF